MVLFSNDRHISTSHVHIPTLLKQLGNEKVILDKLPLILLRRTRVISNNYKTSNVKVKVIDNNNDSDEFFFQEPNKKMPMKISKAYCSKCDESVDDEKFLEKFCPHCQTMLSYKCMNCNMQFSTYNSLDYHLQNPCEPPTSHHCMYANKIKNKMIKNKYNKLNAPLSNGVKKIKATSVRTAEINDDALKIKDKIPDENNLSSVKGSSHNSQSSGRRGKVMDNSIKKDNAPENSFIAEYNETKYYVICLKPKSEVLKKLCIPCKSKVFDLKAKNCNMCRKNLVLKCVKCGKLFPNLKSVEYHIICCNPAFKFSCFHCEFETTQRYYMREHINFRCEFLIRNSGRDPKNIIICPNCKQAFTGRDSYKMHKNFCSVLKCKFCSYKTNFKNVFTMHLKTHAQTKKGTFFRPPAKYLVKHNSGILTYIKEYCSNCNSEINFDNKIKREVCLKCKQFLRWKCTSCNKLYKSITSIKHHVKLTHVEEKEALKCVHCQKKFTNYLKLRAHVKYCATNVRIKCQHCEFKTKDAHKIKIHHKKRHPDLPLDEIYN